MGSSGGIEVRTILFAVCGVSAGADLSLLASALIAQAAPQIVPPNPTTPQQAATVIAVRWGLFVLYAILGSGTWALSRPPGLKPYFTGSVKHPIFRMFYTGFAWGMFALALGEWLGWEQGLTTAMVFLLSVGWEFMMLAVVWLGQRFSSNPIQFWQDMKAGRAARQRQLTEEDILEETQARPRDDGGYH